MKLSVVVPTHNRNQGILDLVKSIQEQSLAVENFEFIVVTNERDAFFQSQDFTNSVDGLNWSVQCSGELNVNKARNLGLKQSQGEIVFFVDDDCQLIRSNYLEQIIASHEKYPKAVAIGGVYRVDDSSQALDKAYFCIGQQWQQLDNYGDYSSSRLVGGNVSYKKEMLLSNGLKFDESIRYGGSESEFHQRLLNQGFQTILLPSMKVKHNTEIRSEDLVRKAFLQAKSFLLHDIARGFSGKLEKSYQHRRLTLARQISNSDKEFDEIVNGVKLYDWSYNSCLENPDCSYKQILSKSRSIKGQPWIQVGGLR